MFNYAVLGTVLVVTGLSFLPDKPVATPESNYKTYCASCHGEQVEMFVDRKWKFGNTKNELVASIAKGHPDLGMPAWEASLKPDEISALADYVAVALEKGAKFRVDAAPKSPTFASSAGLTVRLDTVARGLGSPWGLSFLPDGGMLVTERSGAISRVAKNGSRTPVSGGPTVLAEGQGGLLDVEVHPQFAQNGLVYFSYSAVKDAPEGKLSTTAVMRAKLDGDRLSDQKILFEAQPWAKTRHHYGSRLVFDKAGLLYFSVGDRGSEKTNPQSLDSDAGKVHRIKDDGGIPADNPFAKSAHPTIYSYGHRNPQGMALNAQGELWENEHGPRGGDEVNIVQKGRNYGWPTISYGINYDGKPITNLTKKDGMEQPVHYWIPSIGPSGMAFVPSGGMYAAWGGNALVGSLRFKYLNRCEVRNGKIVKEELLYPNIGRVRNIDIGPDGYAYVSVEDPGYVFRLVPVK